MRFFLFNNLHGIFLDKDQCPVDHENRSINYPKLAFPTDFSVPAKGHSLILLLNLKMLFAAK